MTDLHPVFYSVDYDETGVVELANLTESAQREFLLRYPTVYVIGSRNRRRQVMLYVGETNDIVRRTRQHLEVDPMKSAEWRKFNQGQAGRMLVIGHEHFNKSLTLDIENKLMLYLSGDEQAFALINGRTNPQGGYYPKGEKNQIFSQIWAKLHRLEPDLFPVERAIMDSALFKASPFHELTGEQQSARDTVIARIQAALAHGDRGQLIIVQGEAGSGKTVLLSSLFYQIQTTLDREGELQDRVPVAERLVAKLMVNHDQQVKVYEQVMTRLGLFTPAGDEVNKPTHYINLISPDDSPIDVALVDEAHLLYTQGKQAYRGENQLDDLLQRSRVVVAILDPHQVLATNGYRTREAFQQMADEAATQGNLVTLTNQLRMGADATTLDWIRSFVFGRVVKPIPSDDTKGYELRIFETPGELAAAIRHQAANLDKGLSRMVATFDWPFIDKKRPDDDPNQMWRVRVGTWSMPWNLQIPVTDRRQARRNKRLAWAEQPQTIDEIGSTFTVQGLDLNYVGVILGPSVGFENGRVVIRPEHSANRNATMKRTLNGQKLSVAKELIQNEVNVLMTRGVHGLYIYAVDPALRQALRHAQAFGDMAVAEPTKTYD
ncbi:DUF2075 domain-containing protein [Lacticaseibacillus suihuaensis]